MKQKIRDLIGDDELLLEAARLRKLQWFSHTTRGPGSLARNVMHGIVEGARRGGKPNSTGKLA